MSVRAVCCICDLVFITFLTEELFPPTGYMDSVPGVTPFLIELLLLLHTSSMGNFPGASNPGTVL